ncbi:Chloramphenicol-sensitive protein [Oleispira antarctica RB-8]|uniref:Chloramphenicol-sensitive protein n=1 Tax=Oleispira antarctica RB-8 TaxID=698738 RepID=R4YJH9_OLEAN|nr:Chloramphenicol-sensitive protein [Oleispira antarctica RB-8]
METKTETALYTSLGVLAFIVWGLVPIYFHQLDETDSVMILAHRVFWSALILISMVMIKPKLIRLSKINLKNIGLAFAAGILMNLSWLGLVYATLTQNIMAASLAFYIAPVMVFFIGFILFKESITRSQKISLSLMILAIAVYVFLDKKLPVLSLFIASFFAFYFVAKKFMNMSTFEAVFLEHVIFLPVAAVYIGLNMTEIVVPEIFTLMGTAPLQLLSILLLSMAITKIPLTKISLLQYIEPTFHLGLAVWIYNEPVSDGQKYAFIIIILSIIVSSASYKRRPINH